MAAFDLGQIIGAERDSSQSSGFGTPFVIGEGITADITTKRIEGRLYAGGAMAAYMSKIVGGSMSLAVMDILASAQQTMFGLSEKTRTVGSSTVKSLVTGENSIGKELGVSLWARCLVDGVAKYEVAFVHQVRFAAPSLKYKTADGSSIVFQTPSTVGEFMGDKDDEFVEVAVVDDKETALAWCYAVLGGTPPAANS